MQSAKAEAPKVGEPPSRARLILGRSARFVPYVYLVLALPTALKLCFLTPPMQSPDEGRHFLRACQIATGQIVPQIDASTHEAGGVLPAAVSDFVRDKMNPEYFRNEDRLHTIGARLRALDSAARKEPPLSEKRFAPFPGSAIYPPTSYLPQIAGILVAQLFSDKVYIWFYSARIWNAIAAVFLLFVALRLAPEYQFPLLIPAILPISLYQISSASSDAGIISLSVLSVALCIRFLRDDGAWLRAAIVVCLILLTLTKPVHLPFALLLLPAYKRLGWRRAILFFSITVVAAAGLYLAWSSLVRPIFATAGRDFAGHNPALQAQFVLAHPVEFAQVLLRTIKVDGRQILFEVIGWLGWAELPLPVWLYKVGFGFIAAVLFLILLNIKRVDISRFLFGCIAALAMLFAIFLAALVLWTPVGSPRIPWIQGRYLLPVLAIFAFLAPPLNRISNRSTIALASLILAFFLLSTFTTVRIVMHYYFTDSKILGRNIHELFVEAPRESCHASVTAEYLRSFFSGVACGRADVRDGFRVLITSENGTILGESDPALAGAEFPFDRLPGSSRSRWLVHFWRPNRDANLYYWLVAGNQACVFGPDLNLQPYYIPDA